MPQTKPPNYLHPFPAFSSLPSDDDIDDDYYDCGAHVPYRNWCLLAEIIHVETFMRLCIDVRDREGEEFKVAIYTDKGAEMPPAGKYKMGHTVAILYAHQHPFLDGSSGIRLEVPTYLQVSHILFLKTAMTIFLN